MAWPVRQRDRHPWRPGECSCRTDHGHPGWAERPVRVCDQTGLNRGAAARPRRPESDQQNSDCGGTCGRRACRRRRPAAAYQRDASCRSAIRGGSAAEGAAHSGGGAGAMTLPTLCIERPVMTTLLTMAIVAVGSVGYFFLPVAALPQVHFPTIAVSTTLPGANPPTMAASISTPLERAFSAIAGIDSLTSVSGLGIGRRTLTFNLHPSIDAAGQDIQ